MGQEYCGCLLQLPQADIEGSTKRASTEAYFEK